MRYAILATVLWLLFLGFGITKLLPLAQRYANEFRARSAAGAAPTRPYRSPAMVKNDVSEPNGLVLPLTGNLNYVKRDLQTADAGPGIVFARSYNSLDSRVTALGPGWTHNYEIRLTSLGDGSGSVSVVGPQGRTDVHRPRPDGSFEPPPEVDITLKHYPDGSYVATHANGLAWFFRADGKLDRVLDPDGNLTSLEYDPQGRLVTISDPSRRGSLRLDYDAPTGRLTAVTDWMSPPRTARYGYDDQGRLTSVTDREGHVTRYAYQDNSSRLTTITDARGHRALAVDYDYTGRVAHQCNARTVQTGHCYAFTYFRNGAGPAATRMDEPPTSFEPNKVPSVFYIYDGWERIIRKEIKSASSDTLRATDYRYDDAWKQTANTTGGATPAPDPARWMVVDRSRVPHSPFLDPTGDYGDKVMSDLPDDADSIVRDAFGRITYAVVGDAGAEDDLDPGAWSIEYDREDRPTWIHVQDPSGQKTTRTTLTYDAVGNLIEISKDNGEVTRYDYDERDAVTDVHASKGPNLHVEYDERGLVARYESTTQDSRAHTLTTYGYDDLSRLRWVEYFPSWPDQRHASTYQFAYSDTGKATTYQLRE